MFILTYFTYKQCIYLVAIWGGGDKEGPRTDSVGEVLATQV